MSTRAGRQESKPPEERFGRLDVMVANAGIGILCKAVEMPLADWRRQTAENLDGVFLSIKHAVPAMRPPAAARSSSCRRWPASGDRPVWRATAPPKEECGCSQKRSQWNVQQRATGFASIPSIRGSSTRRFGQR